MKVKLLLIAGLVVLLTPVLSMAEAAVTLPAFTQDTPKALLETITITPNANQMQTAVTLEAPFAFNAVVPSWVTAGESPEIELRTSADGQGWSEWHHIEAHEDWNLPDAGADAEIVGDMIVVPEADGTHRFIQYKIETTENSTPLSTLSFTFIDTTEGPTTEEMLIQQQALDNRQPASETTGYPRPAVISRSVWCIYDTCTDTSDLTYSPVTHLIIHHTVSSNDSVNWASTVRAIYIYHRDDQDWGDIGYNYLVDRTGVIYEGHMNEDYLNQDVVGIHAGGANTGGLGTALLGTFTTAEEFGTYDVPPYAMKNAVANLFAWKADQRNIEIYDASRPISMTWGLPHIMSHRDVYGGTNTLCPGGNAQNILPWLREEVANRIGQVSPYTYVSEESSAFTKANVNWFVAPGGCGWQGHAYYAWTTTNPALSKNWAEWRLTVPTAGLYEIEVYAPYCDTNNSETNGAVYTINNGSTTKTAVVSHQENVGLWMTLGSYELAAGNNNTLRLTNLTSTDSGVGIWFDDVRFKPVTTVNITHNTPVDNSWLSQRTADFSWTIENPALVQTLTLDIATDAAFTNVIKTMNWATTVTNTSHTFSQDYGNLYWRVSANTASATTVSTPTRFGLDTETPTSIITAVYTLTNNLYLVTTTASDTLSGISQINLEYQADGDSTWTAWNGGAVFTPPQPGTDYYLRSKAVDIAGNQEPPHATPDINTNQAKPIPHVIMLPVITK